MIKINQGFWFPSMARIVGFIFLGAVLLSFSVPVYSVGSYLLRVILIVLCSIVITSRSFLLFNLQNNIYREYMWMLGLKFGSSTAFDSIEKLFINKVNLVTDSFKYATVVLPNSSEVRTSVYKCFIKFGNGEKMLLDSDEDKDKLINRLREYNKVMKTILYDTTSHETFVIE